MFPPTLRRISPPRTPQIHDHDPTTITHEYVTEIFSPQYAASSSQPPPMYFRPNPLGLYAEGDGAPFPPPMEADTQMEILEAPPPTRLQIEGQATEGGWQPDGFGGLRYQGHGKVEDVDGSNSHTKRSKSDSNENSITPGDYDGPIIITRPLPSTATPPPRPNFRERRIEIPELSFGDFTSAPGPHWRTMSYPKLSSLNPSRVGSPSVDQRSTPWNVPHPQLSSLNPSRMGSPSVDQRPPMSSTPLNINRRLPEMDSHHPLFYSSPNPGQPRTPPVEQHPPMSGNAPLPQTINPSPPKTQSPVRERPTRPPPLSPMHLNRELDNTQESSMLQSNLRLVHAGLLSLDNISWIFENARSLEDIRPQLAVDMCGRIKAALTALTMTLNRRSRFTEEHWILRSQTWHKKYSERLLSLRRTLQRLSALEERMKGSRPGLKTVNKALEKLRQFEFKLSDLNSRFNKLFDRLRIRQLHAMLTESISEEERMRRSDFSTREAYKNKRTEGKAVRARLRRDYVLYHTGRRLSLVP